MNFIMIKDNFNIYKNNKELLLRNKGLEKHL